jgi:ribonuclease HI
MLGFSILSLVLHFDGSLRPPRDPIPGFTRYTPKSLHSDKMAACSAAIFSDEEDLHSMGGKMLTLLPRMTSADAEYEGLLMGLDKLRGYLSDEQNMNAFMSHSDPALTVKGDCKVIVDQFQGKSKPRMMEMKYLSAIDKIHSIQHMCSARSDKKIAVRFQHIPRDDNHLCDAICRLLVNQKQRSSVASIYNAIKLGESEVPESSGRPIKKKSKKKAISKNSHFQTALDGIVSSTELDFQLCHSSQLALACELASAAIQQNDAVVIGELSDFFLVMSRRWGHIYYYEDTNSWEVKNSLASLSMQLKELATQNLKRASDEDTIRDGVTELLQKLAVFFTNNNDMESTGGVESPYMDVSELVDEIDNEGWKEVQQWDILASDAIKRDVTTLDSGVWLSRTMQS